MSFLALHMSKFKKDAIRGIQSHNRRERKSRSNPDIDYSRSGVNYELCQNGSGNYSQTIQNRIDDLLLTKKPRKDAVMMCGIVVSSDKEFFAKLSPEETRRFFEESYKFLEMFAGPENVISAVVHMDEKTPHMHFEHVPVTREKSLSAKEIYTQPTLRWLQDALPKYLQKAGFDIQRGVKQESGSAKKHLDTREFKQQKEALAKLTEEHGKKSREYKEEIDLLEAREKELRQRIDDYTREAQEAEQFLQENGELPEVSLFNYKSAMRKAEEIIESLRKALALKHETERKNEELRRDSKLMEEKLSKVTADFENHLAHAQMEKKRLEEKIGNLESYNRFYKAFQNQPEIVPLYKAYYDRKKKESEQAKRQEEEREKAELQRKEEERLRQQQNQPRRMRMR